MNLYFLIGFILNVNRFHVNLFNLKHLSYQNYHQNFTISEYQMQINFNNVVSFINIFFLIYINILFDVLN